MTHASWHNNCTYLSWFHDVQMLNIQTCCNTSSIDTSYTSVRNWLGTHAYATLLTSNCTSMLHMMLASTHVIFSFAATNIIFDEA